MTEKILSYAIGIGFEKSDDDDIYGEDSFNREYVKYIDKEKSAIEYGKDIIDMLNAYDLSDDEINRYRYLNHSVCFSSLIYDQVVTNKKCFYCKKDIQETNLRKDKSFDFPALFSKSIFFNDFLTHQLYECSFCGWWTIHIEQIAYEIGGILVDRKFILGSLSEYDISDFDLPIKLAREYLKEHPKIISNYDPFKFELLIKDCFEDLYGNCEVIHMGGRKDRGIDLKIVKNNKITALVQIKRRQNININESVDVIRSLHGVMLREHVPNGIIVTTARNYTKDAYEEKKVKSFPNTYSMQLLKFDDVLDLLNLKTKAPFSPWKDYYHKYNNNEMKFDKRRVDIQTDI